MTAKFGSNGAPTSGLVRPQDARVVDATATCQRLYDSFSHAADGTVSPLELINRLGPAGISASDPRLRDTLAHVRAGSGDVRGLSLESFVALCQRDNDLVARALRGDLVVPDFATFTDELTGMYEALLGDERGAVADYIPQLARVDPNQLAIAVCTVDGQRFAIGDSSTGFCVESVCKPINYCLALEEHGADVVHRHVGREPSGRGFNELTLNNDGLPHNPMINSGAIMCCSLIRPELDAADRFDHYTDAWRKLSGGGRIGFNNAVYLSERQTADRNFALGYSMRESGAFPPGTNLLDTLEFYFQCCSLEIDAESLAVVAASLAGGGVSPLGGGRIFSTGTVQNCLSLMSSCGMYDYSGEFAFSIGLPAKSGVSGALMLVIPQVMGICIWSPRLDPLGNSVRGIEFCRSLVSKYNFHVFDGLVDNGNSGKRDPRKRRHEAARNDMVRLCWAASQGDLDEVRALVAGGVDPNVGDYDGRTALHLAASEGRYDIVEYLLDQGVDSAPVDRWGGTPVVDAVRGNHQTIVDLLRERTADLADAELVALPVAG
ncbi:L-glutaminase [Micromonospora pisi]|uniref:Glutaminase n=1 Tax=Micromonospora pisi TaxID=589240 RepID=A0A495JPG3_9ACTN|nr:glutaminase A [Micromonospora pisi]RKR90274.1 L-glutaminase [Micromonospora pisi]